MQTREQDLVSLATAVAKSEGIALSTLGFRVANEGKFFAGLADGKSVSQRRYLKVRAELKRLERNARRRESRRENRGERAAAGTAA